MMSSGPPSTPPPPRPPPPPTWYMQGQDPPRDYHDSLALSASDGTPEYRAKSAPPGSRVRQDSVPSGSRLRPDSVPPGARDELEMAPESRQMERVSSARRSRSGSGGHVVPSGQFGRSGEPRSQSEAGASVESVSSHSGSRNGGNSRSNSGSRASEDFRSHPASRASMDSDHSGSESSRVLSRFSLNMTSPNGSGVGPYYPEDSRRNSGFSPRHADNFGSRSSVQSSSSSRQRGMQGIEVDDPNNLFPYKGRVMRWRQNTPKEPIEMGRLKPSEAVRPDSLPGYTEHVPRKQTSGGDIEVDFLPRARARKTVSGQTASELQARRMSDLRQSVLETARTTPARRVREVKCFGRVLRCPDVRRLSECRQKCRRWRPNPRTMRRIGYSIPVILVGLLFLALMPVSFVYIEHYQMALQRQKLTGVVDKSVTIYPGCYVEGPDAELLIFKMSAHVVEKSRLAVFSASRMEIWISLKLIYFIRPEELGELYATYASDYEDVIDIVVTATIKNRASLFTLDEVRLQRPLVEQWLHDAVRDKLTEFHIDVRNLWLGKVDIPPNISQNLVRSVLQQVSAETAHYAQANAVVAKETEKYTEAVRNTELEVQNLAESGASLIRSRGQARADHITESSTIAGWDAMCQRLGVNVEEQKLSVLFITSLSRMDNLYFAPSEVGRNFTYSHFPGYAATLAKFGQLST